jgi:hypothetical protein
MWAALLALLLTASALGQAAHFLLVPHTICAEHGELLELGEEGAAHAAASREHRADGDRQPRAASPEAVAAHEHCQVLARGQREQALPQGSFVALVPVAPPQAACIFGTPAALARALSALTLAPKTSPPLAPRG